MNMTQKKACRDCRFFWNDSAHRCGHEKSEGQNVIGDTTWRYAEDMRDSNELCGFSGALFEPVPPLTAMQIAARAAIPVALLLAVAGCTVHSVFG